ncbi:MAG TPA: GDP-mannose 4,6-dehydratase [Gaiellaceae bacterium]|nr:GDP-mannose 4,6-dehydratase [Gaiellaceae bacterium]
MTGTPPSGYDWSGRRVLVTGTGGFIGSHLAERLVELGAEVRGFFRYTSGGGLGWIEHTEPEVRNAIDPVLGDLRDADAVHGAVRGTELVFHLGALIGIPYSYVHPRETFDTNVAGTLNVVTAARDHDLSLLVHTSTSETYGTAAYVPIDERHPLQAQSPYSATKIAADKLVESFHHSFAVPVTTVRPFNTYGPRQSPRAVIPTIASQALQGTTLALGHLSPTRDFTYVSDTVEGFIRAAEVAAIGQTCNLGSGEEISVGGLVELVGEILGKQLHVEHDPKRDRPEASEVDRLVADNTRAREVLGWEPTVSLRDGLRRTLEWIGETRQSSRPGAYAI